jgi:hypothetical protein
MLMVIFGFSYEKWKKKKKGGVSPTLQFCRWQPSGRDGVEGRVTEGRPRRVS